MSHSDPRPNILLITTDQQRFDTSPLYGNNFVRTPHLEALAQTGTVFEHAFVQSPICMTSRACIQTGRYPHQHGLQHMEEIIDDTPGLPAWETTFMERLQNAGYHTAAFGKIHMQPEKGFHEMQVTGGKGARWIKTSGQSIGLAPLGRDYAAWLEARNPGAYDRIHEQRCDPAYSEYQTALALDLPLEDYVDTWIGENTAEFVRRDHDKPFFAWCGFCGPHPPIDPPAPYDTMYAETEVPLPPNYQFNEDGSARATTATEDAIARRFVAYYYGLVTLIDDLLGRILAALDAAGVREKTLIIFTSDHGEMMFEYDKLGKGNFLEPVIRVPLVVAPPRPQGKPAVSPVSRCASIAEVFDAAPTILDYAGAEIPASMSAVSLRAQMESTEAAGRPFAMSEFQIGDQSKKGVCLRTPRYKYVYWDTAGEQFFDLEKDPFERENLINSEVYHAEIDKHRKLLIEKRLQTEPRA